MSDLIHLVYLSSAANHFTSADLEGLMEQAVANNARVGVTGILLYRDGNFMQAIEGTPAAIDALYRKIAADPRHRHLIKVLQEPITEREFAGWSMAFRDLNSSEVRQHPAFNEYLNLTLAPAEFADKPSRVRRLLETFRKSVR
jgi:hypothetical protein